jgi:hypothetical protein
LLTLYSIEKIPQLVENYDNRIKKFVFDLVEDPISLKSPKNSLFTTRQEYVQEQRRLKGTKINQEFNFKHFLTDKEKKEKYQKGVNYTISARDALPDADDLTHTKSRNKSSTYLQPSMRYKPRTDLERIYDTINQYSYGRAEKDLIDSQLKLLELNNFKKLGTQEEILGFSHKKNKLKVNEKVLKALKEEREKLRDLPNSENLIKSLNKIIMMNKDPKVSIDDSHIMSSGKQKQHRRKYVDNSYAKSLMKEYHVKTHFKAASVYSLCLNPNLLHQSQYPKTFRKKNHSFIDNVNSSFHQPQKSIDLATSIYNFRSASDLNLLKTKETFQQTSENFNIDVNPLKKTHEEVRNVPKESLSYLRTLYLKSNNINDNEKLNNRKLKFLSNIKSNKRNNDSIIKNNPVIFFENYSGLPAVVLDEEKRDEERILVGNEVYYKSQVDLISKNVLTKCNYLATKSEFNNTKLKSGQGKMAMTAGMTVNEFSSRYHIPK